MKHYITYFSPLRLCLEPTHVRQSVQASLRLCAHLLVAFTLHFSLTCCHTQRSAVEEQRIEVDSVKVHEEMVTIHLSDSLLQECIFQADSLSFVAHADSSVQIVARNATFASRKSKVKEERAKVCIEDTTSVHIRDTTAVKNQVDRQAVYEPPDFKTFFLFFGLMILVYLVFPRR